MKLNRTVLAIASTVAVASGVALTSDRADACAFSKAAAGGNNLSSGLFDGGSSDKTLKILGIVTGGLAATGAIAGGIVYGTSRLNCADAPVADADLENLETETEIVWSDAAPSEEVASDADRDVALTR